MKRKNLGIVWNTLAILPLGIGLVACGGGGGGGSDTPTSNPTPQTPSTLTDNGDGTISDSATGLVWQKDENATANHSGAALACGNLALAGYSDWRLPSVTELMSIADYSKKDPAIDTTAFPGVSLYQYGTSTISSVSASDAWYVDFAMGVVDTNPTIYPTYYRCVRGNTMPAPSFNDNGDGTITDNTSGLMWQKCSAGQSNNASCTGTGLAKGVTAGHRLLQYAHFGGAHRLASADSKGAAVYRG